MRNQKDKFEWGPLLIDEAEEEWEAKVEESPGAVEAERDGVGAWETGGSCVVATGSVYVPVGIENVASAFKK